MPVTAATAPKPAGSKTPLLLGLGGVALLVAAGAFVVVSQNGSARTSPSPSGIASATATPTEKYTPPATPEDETAEPATADPGTSEPSPVGNWTAFSSPDKKWVVRFPSTMTPLKQSMALNSGLAAGDMTMYIVADGSDAYAVAFFDFPKGTLPASSSVFLDTFSSGMASGLGGTLVSSEDAMVGKIPARDIVLDKGTQTIHLRVFFVGDRVYMLMVMGDTGDVVYPQHFYSTFALK
jgi:hypothetical protein